RGHLMRESLPQFRRENKIPVRRHPLDPLLRMFRLRRIVKSRVDLNRVEKLRQKRGLVKSLRLLPRIHVPVPVRIGPPRRTNPQICCFFLGVLHPSRAYSLPLCESRLQPPALSTHRSFSGLYFREARGVHVYSWSQFNLPSASRLAMLHFQCGAVPQFVLLLVPRKFNTGAQMKLSIVFKNVER